jgi:molybdate transport system substrate-binding protein
MLRHLAAKHRTAKHLSGNHRHKRMAKKHSTLYLAVIFLNMTVLEVYADEIMVAVASNFHSSLKVLKQKFEQSSQHRITIVSGSTGKLYAQIINGAPFDLFMSADKESVLRLEQSSLAVKNSRFIYANGRLALWSVEDKLVGGKGAILFSDKYNKLAIANPKLAPYGQAALEFLENSRLENVESKIVKGENISHAFHLVASGAAEIGIIALAQLKNPKKPVLGSYWIIPENKHLPIEQHAIVLNTNQAVMDFVNFIRSDDGISIIESFGYQVPAEKLLEVGI